MKEFLFIFYRNVFYLTNGVMFLVVVALYIFGDPQSALFLGGIMILNISFGLVNDLRSWYRLRELQLLTAPHITLIDKKNNEQTVLVEEIKKGDLLKIKTGDQVPCDGILVETFIIELNEGLITGESQTFMRKSGDKVLAGSIITAGQGIMRANSPYTESRISRMTDGLKGFDIKMSPIQNSVTKIVSYTSMTLFAVIIFILVKGIYFGVPNLLIIKNIGTMASILVPQGFIFSMTVFYAYGAIHLLSKNILLQEVNATEKLGLIKNLCIDKTGTLTENTFEVEKMYRPENILESLARELAAAYFFGSKDESQISEVVKKFVGKNYSGTVTNSMPFSATRSYGAIALRTENSEEHVFVGPPEFFLPTLGTQTEVNFVQNVLKEEAVHGKRLLCVVKSDTNSDLGNISHDNFQLVAIFVLSSKLREGIKETIKFFQDRGVHIRIISGDNAQSVQTIAHATGIKHTEKIITGQEMKTWTAADYLDKVGNYTIFARVVPEQKEQIIFALKKNDFTAMVGDGANDALAIKKADLGIAMFDGAPATRQLASVILTNNSFTALPDGVVLSESIIKNTVIFAAIFLDFAFAGFLFFIFVSVMGYSFPLTPLNITLINYFTVGIPWFLVSYWTIVPTNKIFIKTDANFLQQVLPYVVSSAVLQAIIFLIIFILFPSLNFYVILSFVVVGLIFFLSTPRVYLEQISKKQIKELIYLTVAEIIILFMGLRIPFAMKFFDVPQQTLVVSDLILFLEVMIFYLLAQTILAYKFKIKTK